MRRFFLFSACVCALTIFACEQPPAEPQTPDASTSIGGKADHFEHERQFEVLLTSPHCDVCERSDKDYLLENSAIQARVIELIDAAETSIDIAQFTFSRRPIEEALLRAHARGVAVRLAMNAAQEEGDNPSTRLRDAGLDVRYVAGRDAGSFRGLQHAKYMIVDGTILLTGSNNWSSTGVSFNDENTIVMRSGADDPMLKAFECNFEAIWKQAPDDAADCSNDEVAFTPGFGAFARIRDELREAEHSVDVLMHHLLFDQAVEELADAAARGVRVRVVVNAADRDEISGRDWEDFLAAGGQVRFKRTKANLFQMMHNKLAIIDGRLLLNGSGNWSGSAFFNNFEFYIRYEQPEVVAPFRAMYRRLWDWSLTGESLDAGLSPREQDVAQRKLFYGNLHAHHEATEGERVLDDGKLQREVDGELVDVHDEVMDSDTARHAFEYARDVGRLDFMALTPHAMDDRAQDSPNMANMSEEGYRRLVESAREVTEASEGTFVALPGFEWSTNSTGNHVNVLGSGEVAKVERGDFETLYEGFLPVRSEQGDPVVLMFNHPRTFRHYEGSLNGNWDQIFGVNLQEIPNNSDRRHKFNDFGLDDYPPLSEVRDTWIAGEAMPDEAVVRETLQNIAQVVQPYAGLFEVTVNRGTEFRSEQAQNPSLSEDEDGNIERFVKAHSDWDYYLLNGFRVAPVASHDNHYANWGTGHTSRTVVQADELSEAALLRAMQERAVYASEDENLELRLYAEDLVRAGGELATIEASVTLDVFVRDPDIEGPFLVKVYRGTVGADEVEAVETLELEGDAWHEVEVSLPSTGLHFAYVEVLEPEQDRAAWSAPVWIERRQ